MRYAIFQVDAFATGLFAGNPAALVSMKSFPADTTMQAVMAAIARIDRAGRDCDRAR